MNRSCSFGGRSRAACLAALRIPIATAAALRPAQSTSSPLMFFNHIVVRSFVQRANLRNSRPKKGNLSYLADDRAIREFNSLKKRDKKFPASVTREWTFWSDGGREPKSNSRFQQGVKG